MKFQSTKMMKKIKIYIMLMPNKVKYNILSENKFFFLLSVNTKLQLVYKLNIKIKVFVFY